MRLRSADGDCRGGCVDGANVAQDRRELMRRRHGSRASATTDGLTVRFSARSPGGAGASRAIAAAGARRRSGRGAGPVKADVAAPRAEGACGDRRVEGALWRKTTEGRFGRRRTADGGSGGRGR